MDKTPKVVFAAIVLLGLPPAVWLGWTWSGDSLPPASDPAGAGNLGTAAPHGATPTRGWVTVPSTLSASPTLTPSAGPTPSPAAPTATTVPTYSPTATSAPEATPEPTPSPVEPPPSTAGTAPTP